MIIDLDDSPKQLYHASDKNEYTEFRHCWISGEQTRPLIIGAAHSSMIIVRFTPGGAWPFFTIPMNELTNQVVPLSSLVGNLITDARDQILQGRSLDEKLQRTEDFFRSRFRGPLNGTGTVQEGIRRLSHPGLRPKVRELADDLGISQKHLIALFHDHVGLTPKQFARVSRFQQAITLMGLRGTVELQSVIHQCGYYDQAHFNHEFKEMTTMTPSDYLSSRTEFMNYVFID